MWPPFSPNPFKWNGYFYQLWPLKRGRHYTILGGIASRCSHVLLRGSRYAALSPLSKSLGTINFILDPKSPRAASQRGDQNRRPPRQVQDRVRAPGQVHRAEGRRLQAAVRRLPQQDHAAAAGLEHRAEGSRHRDRQGKERTAVLTRDKKDVRKSTPEACDRSVFSCIKDIPVPRPPQRLAINCLWTKYITDN